MTRPEPQLLRVVYFSFQNSNMDRDVMASDIDEILMKSQENNALVDVTGALIFNAGVFGQVLEGPIDAVEETFERIQMDDRHDSITILESCRIERRSFSGWSMGFVGSDLVSAELFGGIGRKTEFDLASLNGQQIFETLRALALKNELTAHAA